MAGERPICTKEQPAPMGWRARSKHPDAKVLYKTDDPAFDDEKWECPHCGYQWWKESIDS